MGGGSWSSATYAATTARSVATGTTFGYTSAVASGSTVAEVHESLRPWNTANSGPYAGKIVREARDSDEHPNSRPVAIGFDETGSMANVPRVLITKLPEVHGLLERSGVEDPQILVGAYGDADLSWEVASLQVGQFESDNRADVDLDNIYLEGNGGGNGHETAALFWWYIAKYGRTDSWEKRGKPGTIITIGDEITGPVKPDHITQYVKDPDHGVQAALTPAEVVQFAKDQGWTVYHLIIDNSTAHWQRSTEFYTKLLGKNAIVLQSEENVAEVIASLIAIEDGVDLDDVLDDLDALGVSDSTRAEVSKALATVGSGTTKGGVALAEAPADLDTDDDTERF